MKFLFKRKDGGNESKVTGYWLIEWKGLFSIALLHFGPGTREAFHSHAFNCISWLFKGKLKEYRLWDAGPRPPVSCLTVFNPSFKPIITTRDNLHQVFSVGDSWVLTFRGPWSKEWKEVIGDNIVTLTNGRKIVDVKGSLT